MKKAWIAAAAVVALTAAGTAAGTRWSLLLLDGATPHGLAVVQRDATIDLRTVDSACALCARQRAGSPLHSVLLPKSFCPLALAQGPWVAGDRLLWRMTLPGALQPAATDAASSSCAA